LVYWSLKTGSSMISRIEVKAMKWKIKVSKYGCFKT
jgi:hypothetical protein